jgi:hypothetical protein
MKGKTIIMIILAVTVIAIILTWFWLQDVITEYDLERAMPAEQITDTIHMNDDEL